MSMNNFTEPNVVEPFDNSNVYKNRELIYKKIPKEFFQENFKLNKEILSMQKIEIEFKIREVKKYKKIFRKFLRKHKNFKP